jgi:hypothetical protein
MGRGKERRMKVDKVRLDALEIDDRDAFRHVALYAELERVVRSSALEFVVPARGGAMPWDRALLLNLLFWEDGTSDVLCEHAIAADVVAHVAWHHLCSRHVKPSPEAALLGESIASAFDLYLVGRLLGHSPDSSFLATQVPRMAEVALDAGLTEEAFESLLASVAAEPERAFEDLRALLFDVTRALLPARGVEEATTVLATFDAHRFAPLLHHYELTTWVLRTRLDRAQGTRDGDGGDDARTVDAALRSAADPLAWLEKAWLSGSLDEGGL